MSCMKRRPLHLRIMTALAAGPWLATALLCLDAPTTPADSPAPAPADTVWLDDLPHGFIANPYGPPRSRLSFGKTPLRIAGRSFDRGLGTHAPSRLELNLDRRASRFTAFVGVDQGAGYRTNFATWDRTKGAPPYVYDGNDDVFDKAQGATICFRVMADGRELFNSGPLTETSEPRQVSLPVTGVERLVLLADPGADGSFADHADWAEARLELIAGATGKGLVLSAPVQGIIINHVGFTPASAKLFLVDADQPRDFAVISARTGQSVFSGHTTRRTGDWGVMFEGDFSPLREPGTYYVRCAQHTSAPFVIRSDLDQHLLAKHLNWFLMQRCGDPQNGWERGQHADDGRRRDNGRHQDVSGGWHDAADLRKWCMTVTGLWALTEWASTLAGPLRPRVLDEIRWGNKYFLAMQEPDGFLMSYIGGDVERHGDNNRFTDNQPGTADDRVIATDPAAPEIQWVFILSQINAARAFATEDPAYAERCRQAAERAYAWMTPRLNTHDAYSVGGALAAASRLFNLTADPRLRDDARRFLTQLCALQETNTTLPYGFFYTGEAPVPAHERSADAPAAPTRRIPAHNLYMGNLPLWGLCVYAEVFPAPAHEPALEALQRYVDGYCLPFDQRSTFGLVPYALYPNDPGGGRRLGPFFYRWAYVNREDNEWWNGINPHIASTGAALAKAARLLHRPELRQIAQRQLDFIYGANPFDASTAEGLGHNQPDFFKTTEHVPHTPWISGAITAGIGSSHDDQPVLLPGWWQTTEYWMEAVAHTLLLIRELTTASSAPAQP